MENKETYHLELISKYLSGEADANEIRELNSWIEDDIANKKVFEGLHKTWLLLQKEKIEEQIDTEAEWSKFKKSVDYSASAPASSGRPPIIRTLFGSPLRAAASVILLLVSVLTVLIVSNRNPQQIIVAEAESIKTELPDGSVISLQTGSSISYPKQFSKDKRAVELSGDAHFKVEPDKDHPFVISVSDIVVEVLGTSFFINDNTEEKNVEVIVTSGRVAVYFADKPEEKTILTAGERAVSSTETKQIEKKSIDNVNYHSWKTKKIAFTNAKLIDVANTLNQVYNTDIKVDENIRNCKITASFDNQPITSVMKVLRATLDVSYSVEGNTIIISGEACE